MASLLVRLVKLAARPIRKAKQNESGQESTCSIPSPASTTTECARDRLISKLPTVRRVIVQQHLVPFESPPGPWKPKEEGAEHRAQKALALIWVLAKMELRATFLTDPFGFLAPALVAGV